MQNRSPEHEFNDYDEKRFLSAIGAINDKSGDVSVAGLLIFGKEYQIRKWRKRHLIDLRVNRDHLDETVWIDRFIWEGNLFDGFFKLYPKLTEGIPVPHIIRDAESIEDTPVHVAIREAFINLLVHTDYAESDPALIIKSPEGYLFRNPGASRISRQDLFTGNRSDPRNPNLLFMFRLIGLADEAGSGIPKIIRKWKELGFQLPDVEVGTERYEFEIRLKNAHLLTDEDREWLSGFNEEFDEHHQLALICARYEGQIDNERLRAMSAIHPADATKVLTSLRDRGLLLKVNDKRGSFYILPDLLFDKMGKNIIGFDDSLVDKSGLGTKYKFLKEKAKNLKETLQTLKEDEEILKEINKIQKEKTGRKFKREALEAAIIRLCEIKPRKSSHLAELMQISQQTIVTSYLTPMVNRDKLIRTGHSPKDRSGTYIAKADA